MVVGGALGILFVTLLRRVMVEDPELPFPESVAASEIHKAGQQGAGPRRFCSRNMGFGGLSTCWASSTCSVRAAISSSRRQIRHQLRSHGPLRPRQPKLPAGAVTTSPLRDQSRVSWRGIHHRPAAGVAELCWRRHRVGLAGSADSLSWAARTWSARIRSCRARSFRTDAFWAARPLPCGASSCGRSPSAACWWAPASRCSACARAWAPAWRARSPI